jgi:cytoskeletal protein CcmA (bactofilin family)
VLCGYADIIGNFNGSLSVDGLLTIKSDGIVEGQVTVGKLAVESGATLNAQCSMKAASVKSMVDEKTPKAEKTA